MKRWEVVQTWWLDFNCFELNVLIEFLTGVKLFHYYYEFYYSTFLNCYYFVLVFVAKQNLYKDNIGPVPSPGPMV